MGTISVTLAPIYIVQRVRSVFGGTMNPHPSRAAPRLYKGLPLRGGGALYVGGRCTTLTNCRARWGRPRPGRPEGAQQGGLLRL